MTNFDKSNPDVQTVDILCFRCKDTFVHSSLLQTWLSQASTAKEATKFSQFNQMGYKLHEAILNATHNSVDQIVEFPPWQAQSFDASLETINSHERVPFHSSLDDLRA